MGRSRRQGRDGASAADGQLRARRSGKMSTAPGSFELPEVFFKVRVSSDSNDSRTLGF